MGTPTVGELEADLGRRLRDVRIAAGHSQEELARLANLSRGAVKNLEAGRGSTVSTLIKVLRALDRADWLDRLDVPADTFSPLDVLAHQSKRAPGPPRVKRTARTSGGEVAGAPHTR